MERLVVTDVVPQTVTTSVEFDAPALRVIVHYGETEPPGALLYWVLGGEDPGYSFGIDVNGTSRRIQLVELCLYGEGIHPWPSGLSTLPGQQGVPVIDTGAWEQGSSIRDDDELFVMQSDGERLRVALPRSTPCTRIQLGACLALDLSEKKEVCAAIFQGIAPSVVDWFQRRYGLLS